MIERLTGLLQALAAPANEQVDRYPELKSRAEQIALDYCDAFRLVCDCPQLILTTKQRRALDAVAETLDSLSVPGSATLWSEYAIRTSPRWKTIRRLAMEALRALGQSTDPSVATQDR